MSRVHPFMIITVALLAARVLPLGAAEAVKPSEPARSAAPASEPAKPAQPAKSAAPTSAPAPAPAAPVSDAAKANEIFQSIYGDDFKRVTAARDGAGAAALAAKLFEAAQATDVPPVMAAVLCEKACELGLMDPRGYDTVLAASNLLARKAPAKADAAHDAAISVRQRQYDAAVMPADRARAGSLYVNILVSTAAAKAKAGAFDEAIKRYRQAGVVARAIRLPAASDIDAAEKRVLDLQKLSARLSMLTSQVKADPADHEARDQLVQLLLVDCDKPVDAARFIDATSDAALRKYVPAAAKGVAAAPELACMELADWYRGLAAAAAFPASKTAMLLRARAYYQRFLGLHSAADINRTKAELALKMIETDLEKMGVKPPRRGGP